MTNGLHGPSKSPLEREACAVRCARIERLAFPFFQADVWVELLKRLAYRQLVFVHSSDTDGRALLGRFQSRTQDDLQVEQDNNQEVKVQVG